MNDPNVIVTTKDEDTTTTPSKGRSKKRHNRRSNRIVFDETNSIKIRVSFEIKLSGEGAETNAKGYYNTNVAKDLNDTEIRSVINQALTRRFANSRVFSNTNIECTFEKLENDDSTSSANLVPLPVAVTEPSAVPTSM